MADRYTKLKSEQIEDDGINQSDLDITNTPIDGQILQINMPNGDFTAIDAPDASTNAENISKNEANIVLNAFRIAINGSLSVLNMVDGIVDEYEDETGINTGASSNQSYDSVNDLYSPSKPSITTSPFAHYKLNDNAGNTTVTDDGTGSNNGIATTNTSNLSITGKINNAFDFNGTSESINVNSLQADIESDITGSFSMWINIDVFDAVNYIFEIGDLSDAEDYWYLRANSSGKLSIGTVMNTSTPWAMSSTSTLSTGTWYHIVVVQDGVSPKMYIDAVDVTDLTTTSDTTAWFVDFNQANIDFASIGQSKRGDGGASNPFWFNGQIDDFRYYQNKALTSAEVALLYNSGNGTEADQPEGSPENMTLLSNSFTAEAQPDTGRIVLSEEDVDTVTLNTDLVAKISRDGGTTFSTVTLASEGEYESGKNILTGSVDISGQPAGTSMVYEIDTANNKDLKIHGTGLLWD